MPVNANPEYVQAEAEFHKAQTPEQKIKCLEKMISLAPKHKSSENLLANLKTRYKKFKQELEKSSKSKTSGKGIKKHETQAIIVGETNSGKSTLLNTLTNSSPEIASYDFTTKQPQIGMLSFQGMQIQIIENPAIESEYYDKGLAHTTDTLLILVNEIEQIKKILEHETIKNNKAKKIILFNTKTNLNQNEKRKLNATLKSKKYNFIISNLKQKENLEEIKEKIFQSFDKIRIYTKEPGKSVEKTKPIILKKDSTVKDAAEKILHGFSEKIKQTRITGPSSKFPNQIVGLQHKLKDLDVIEFKTK